MGSRILVSKCLENKSNLLSAFRVSQRVDVLGPVIIGVRRGMKHDGFKEIPHSNLAPKFKPNPEKLLHQPIGYYKPESIFFVESSKKATFTLYFCIFLAIIGGLGQYRDDKIRMLRQKRKLKAKERQQRELMQ